MRNDVRIGIAVGVFVIVVGLVWFVFLSKEPGAGETAEDTREAVPTFGVEGPDEGTPADVIDLPVETPPDDTTAGPAGPAEGPGAAGVVAPVDPGPVEDPDSVDAGAPGVAEGPEVASVPGGVIGPAEVPADDGAVTLLPRHDPDAGPALTPSTMRTAVRRPVADRTDEPSDLAIAPVDPGSRVGEAVEPDTGDGTETAPPGRRRIYVVQEGDDGFWGISKEVYGAGKHWELIRDANPDADTNALRPGQELVIPPLPAAEPQETTHEDLPAGAHPRAGTYVVKEGDTYWEIAKAEYGSGKYFYVLEEANGINPGNLRPGMVLVVPPKPEAPPAVASANGSETAEAPGEEISAGSGEEIYTVVGGDSFWKIARNVYGQGHLWPAIRDANPGIDARNLQPGQKLLIPSIEAARRAVGEDASGATSDDDTSGEAPPGRPVFD